MKSGRVCEECCMAVSSWLSNMAFKPFPGGTKQRAHCLACGRADVTGAGSTGRKSGALNIFVRGKQLHET